MHLSKPKLLLYARVPNPNMLDQGFYYSEIEGLRESGHCSSIYSTNSLLEVVRGDFDGIIAYFYSYSAFASIVAKMRGIPVVVTGGAEQVFRQMAPSLANFLGRIFLFYLCLIFADRILATSNTDLERMQALAWFNRSKIKLSYHAVKAVEELRKENFQRERPSGAMVTICGMDSFENMDRKGLFRAIDLLAEMQRLNPDASLVVIGRTTCKRLAQDYATSKGCGESIQFAGYVTEEEKVHLLDVSRFYIQLSAYEGFGLGALEALAAGCAIVHSGKGGLIDTVAEYGIVVSQSDVETAKRINGFDPSTLILSNWDGFASHLFQFLPERRVKDFLDGFGMRPQSKNGKSLERCSRANH